MLFAHLVINCIILTLRNVECQFYTKYLNDIITVQYKILMTRVNHFQYKYKMFFTVVGCKWIITECEDSLLTCIQRIYISQIIYFDKQ